MAFCLPRGLGPRGLQLRIACKQRAGARCEWLGSSSGQLAGARVIPRPGGASRFPLAGLARGRRGTRVRADAAAGDDDGDGFDVTIDPKWGLVDEDKEAAPVVQTKKKKKKKKKKTVEEGKEESLTDGLNKERVKDGVFLEKGEMLRDDIKRLQAEYNEMKAKGVNFEKMSDEERYKYRDMIKADDQNWLVKFNGHMEDPRRYKPPKSRRTLWDKVNIFTEDPKLNEYKDDFYRSYMFKPAKWLSKKNQARIAKGKVTLKDTHIVPKLFEKTTSYKNMTEDGKREFRRLMYNLQGISERPWLTEKATGDPWWFTVDDDSYMYLFDERQGGPKEPFWWTIPEMSYLEFMSEIKRRNWTHECFDPEAEPIKVDIWENHVGQESDTTHPYLMGMLPRPQGSITRILLTWPDGTRKWLNTWKYPKGKTFMWENALEGGASPNKTPQQFRPVRYNPNVGQNAIGTVAAIKDELFWATEPMFTPEQEREYWTEGGVRNFRDIPISPSERLLDIGYHTNDTRWWEKMRIWGKQSTDQFIETYWLTTFAVIFMGTSLALGLFWKRNEPPSDVLQAMEFAQSKAKARKEGMTDVRFEDVAGIEDQIEELLEVVGFLKSPTDYEALDVKPPKGVLLEGPPGTGKTLMAKAIAGEADVPFYMMSGSEFMEIIVGVGAARIRDLFKRARLNSPCVVFLDEIDAIGGIRSDANDKAQEEQEQTLNQLLTELDGFTASSGIVLIAATNRSDMLDPALLRAGRFDRKIIIEKGGPNARAAILRVHAKKVVLAEEIDWDDVAAETGGFAGADLANLLNEAALTVASEGRPGIRRRDVDDAVDRMKVGSKRETLMEGAGAFDETREVIARHEAGTALVIQLLKWNHGFGADIERVSVDTRGSSHTRTLLKRRDDETYLLKTRAEVVDNIQILTAGMHATKAVGKHSTYKNGDLTLATDEAGKMVTMYGMSNVGVTTFVRSPVEAPAHMSGFLGEKEKFQEGMHDLLNPDKLQVPNGAWEPGETSMCVVTDEISRIIHLAGECNGRLFYHYREFMDEVVAWLIEHKEIEGDDFRAMIRKWEGKTRNFKWGMGGAFTMNEAMEDNEDFGLLPFPSVPIKRNQINAGGQQGRLFWSEQPEPVAASKAHLAAGGEPGARDHVAPEQLDWVPNPDAAPIVFRVGERYARTYEWQEGEEQETTAEEGEGGPGGGTARAEGGDSGDDDAGGDAPGAPEGESPGGGGDGAPPPSPGSVGG